MSSVFTKSQSKCHTECHFAVRDTHTHTTTFFSETLLSKCVWLTYCTNIIQEYDDDNTRFSRDSLDWSPSPRQTDATTLHVKEELTLTQLLSSTSTSISSSDFSLGPQWHYDRDRRSLHDQLVYADIILLHRLNQSMIFLTTVMNWLQDHLHKPQICFERHGVTLILKWFFKFRQHRWAHSESTRIVHRESSTTPESSLYPDSKTTLYRSSSTETCEFCAKWP